MSRRRFLLIGINLALAVASWPLLSENPAVAPPPRASPRDARPLPPSDPPRPFELPGLDRPLFRIALSPEPVQEAAPTLTTRAAIRLLGVALTGEHRIALVESDGLILRVAEGDDLDGWRVTRIAVRAILLTRVDQQLDVSLDPPVEP